MLEDDLKKSGLKARRQPQVSLNHFEVIGLHLLMLQEENLNIFMLEDDFTFFKTVLWSPWVALIML